MSDGVDSELDFDVGGSPEDRLPHSSGSFYPTERSFDDVPRFHAHLVRGSGFCSTVDRRPFGLGTNMGFQTEFPSAGYKAFAIVAPIGDRAMAPHSLLLQHLKRRVDFCCSGGMGDSEGSDNPRGSVNQDVSHVTEHRFLALAFAIESCVFVRSAGMGLVTSLGSFEAGFVVFASIVGLETLHARICFDERSVDHHSVA